MLNRASVNMEKLKTLISTSPIEVGELRSSKVDSSSETLYTYSNLEDLIQCSQHELRNALRSIDAFEYEGYFRIFNVEAEYALAKHTLLSIIAEGYSLDRLFKEDVIRAANNGSFQAPLIEQLVNSYLLARSDSTTEAPTYYFDSKRFSSRAAELVLKERSQGWLLSNFKPAWQKRATDHIEVNVSDLDGIVVLEESGKVDFKVNYLPARSMSHEPKLRLSELFNLKPKWTFAQIKPYLQDLLTHDTTEEKILVQYARSSNGPDGSKLYSSR